MGKETPQQEMERITNLLTKLYDQEREESGKLYLLEENPDHGRATKEEIDRLEDQLCELEMRHIFA